MEGRTVNDGRGTIPASEQYRPAPTHAVSCATCSFYGAGTVDQCGRFDVTVQGDRLCNAWEDGGVPASVSPARTVASNARVTAANPNPGGLEFRVVRDSAFDEVRLSDILKPATAEDARQAVFPAIVAAHVERAFAESTDGDKPVDDGIPARVHYRASDDPDVACATCKFYENAVCLMFGAPVSPSNVCDEWVRLESDHAVTADAAPQSAPPAKVVPPLLHNKVLAEAQKRVDALEPKLAAAIQPILEQAGEQAARTFQSRVTNHLTASLARRADRDALGAIGLEEGRALLASLALTAAADITSASTMIALFPRPAEAAAIAETGGEKPEDIHVTLAYLGDTDEETVDAVRTALTRVAASHPPLEGTVGGVGAFQDQGNGTPAIVLPDVPGLVELRQAVCTAVLVADADYARNHGYQPHGTIAYRDDSTAPPDTATLGAPLHFDSLKIVQGNQVVADFPLTGVRQLTAAGDQDATPTPPQWTAPAPAEVLDVTALIAEIKARTEPIRQAFIKSAMTPVLEAAGLNWDVHNPLISGVLAKSASQVTNITETTQADVMDIIGQSYQAGLSIPDTAEAIRSGMKQASVTRSTLIARCLPAETLVDGAVVRAVTRRWYEGDMAVIVMESGREFTATPNHPMLTRGGWRTAGELNEGDDLVCYFGNQNPSAARDEDVANPPATIAEIFETVATVGIIERRSGGEPDFHGDGHEGEVEIAWPDGELSLGMFAPLGEHLGDDVFAPADVLGHSPFCAECGGLLAIDQSACFCGVSRGDPVFEQDSSDDNSARVQIPGDLFHRPSRVEAFDHIGSVNVVSAVMDVPAVLEEQSTSLLKSATRYSGCVDPSQHDALIHADSRPDHPRAETGDIQLDRVIASRLVSFAGYVFNLCTPYGYFIANGVYTGNTEMTGLANGAAVTSAQLVGQATGSTMPKTWMTAPGALYPRHELVDGLDGQQRALEEAFDVDGFALNYPGDPDGDVSQVANCRCSVSFGQ